MKDEIIAAVVAVLFLVAIVGGWLLGVWFWVVE